ncbi:MAG: hypothetical protein JXQ87_11960 [Bacteroidia bacterium]
MKNIKETQQNFWNRNNKIVLTVGVVPAILLSLYATFGFNAMAQTMPGLNLLFSTVLAFSAVILGLMATTYLSFTYLFMMNEDE